MDSLQATNNSFVIFIVCHLCGKVILSKKSSVLAASIIFSFNYLLNIFWIGTRCHRAVNKTVSSTHYCHQSHGMMKRYI